MCCLDRSSICGTCNPFSCYVIECKRIDWCVSIFAKLLIGVVISIARQRKSEKDSNQKYTKKSTKGKSSTAIDTSGILSLPQELRLMNYILSSPGCVYAVKSWSGKPSRIPKSYRIESSGFANRDASHS